jgi:hypothetical protein
MYSGKNLAGKLSIAQMNMDLQQAQLDLLSAHCTTHQLRLRYSMEDLARFGRRDLVRKSVQTATALSDFYSSLKEKIPQGEAAAEPLIEVTEPQIAEAVARVASYFRQRREAYLPSAGPLSAQQKALMSPYFPADLLLRVRLLALQGARVPNPPFYEEYRSLGFANLPEVTHMHAITFLDVVVFNEAVTDRSLFHGLVHAVQFKVLGLERYAERFVRSFVNSRLHFSVPLESQAFALESRFAGSPSQSFSVEDQVRLWAKQARY